MIDAPELPPLARERARALLDRMAGTHVVVVGDAMLDHFMIGKVSRISPEAPVPVVEFEREFSLPGGAANVAPPGRLNSRSNSTTGTGASGRFATPCRS